MTTSPYRPRPKRDPEVSQLFWQGVYHALVVGLLAGLGLWAFLLLGGAPLASDPNRAVLTLAAWGLFAAAAVCSSVWGHRGLRMVGADLVAAVGYQVEWLVRPFVPEGDVPDRARRVEATAQGLARMILAAPAGIPIMVALAAGGRVRAVNPGALGMLAFLGAVMWVLLAGTVWQWAVVKGAGPRAAPVVSATESRAETMRRSAALDSRLQLAVARAKRAKAEGDMATATDILEQALRDAEAEGRSVAHLQLHWQLAWLYAERGNTDGAMVMFQTVLDLAAPDSEEHEEALAALRRLAARAGAGAALHEPHSRVLEEDTLDQQAP